MHNYSLSIDICVGNGGGELNGSSFPAMYTYAVEQFLGQGIDLCVPTSKCASKYVSQNARNFDFYVSTWPHTYFIIVAEIPFGALQDTYSC